MNRLLYMSCIKIAWSQTVKIVSMMFLVTPALAWMKMLTLLALLPGAGLTTLMPWAAREDMSWVNTPPLHHS